MQNFQQILSQAAQLKQQQLKKNRKGYESLPQFLKSGLGYNKKYNQIRKQHFQYQFRISYKVKQLGNYFYNQGNIEEALNKYEESLSIFRYIQSKSYENMKDEDLSYFSFNCSKLPSCHKQKYDNHMCAIYLNICSCLTKQNKKDQALFSADEALKIKKTAKGHYKKAQAYLKYVNRQTNDVKLGLLQLKEAYAMENNQDLLRQMYLVKDNYQKEQDKSKLCFKSMFEHNSKGESNKQVEQQPKQEREKQVGKEKKQLLQEKIGKQIEEIEKNEPDEQNNEKIKMEDVAQKLMTYTSLAQSKWLYFYQKDYFKRYATLIYSTLKIYNFHDLALEFHSLLGKCQQEPSNYEKSKENLKGCITWLKLHPMEKIKQYIERYDVQINWIKKSRKKDNSSFQIMHQQSNLQEKRGKELNKEEKENEGIKVDSQKNDEQKKVSTEKAKQEGNNLKKNVSSLLRQRGNHIAIVLILILIIVSMMLTR